MKLATKFTAKITKDLNNYLNKNVSDDIDTYFHTRNFIYLRTT